LAYRTHSKRRRIKKRLVKRAKEGREGEKSRLNMVKPRAWLIRRTYRPRNTARIRKKAT
jgi:hypothetical protein